MRLDQDRQQSLEHKRLAYAKKHLTELGIEIVYETYNRIDFLYKEKKCSIFPYSGWHTGSTIKDGRGINELINQLKS